MSFHLPARTLLAAVLGVAATVTPAQDRADIDRTTITGNKELPKVLYIVPWKKPIPGALASRPRTSLLDEALAPVDRAEFRRQLHYRAQLTNPQPVTVTPQESSP